MPTNHSNTKQEKIYIKSKVIKNFVQTPYTIVDASNISPVARLLWIYIESNADDYFPDRKVISEHLGISPKTVTAAKNELLKHNMLFLEEVETKYKKIKHYLFAQDPSCWVDVVFKNNRSNKAGVNIPPAAGVNIPPAAGVKIAPNNIKENREKNKLINEADAPPKESKLASHPLAQELKANKSRSRAKLEEMRSKVSKLEKEMASRDSKQTSREVFIEYLPKTVTIDQGIKTKISEGLKHMGVCGDKGEWNAALSMAYRIYSVYGQDFYSGMVDRISNCKHKITAREFSELRSQPFQERFKMSLFDYITKPRN